MIIKGLMNFYKSYHILIDVRWKFWFMTEDEFKKRINVF